MPLGLLVHTAHTQERKIHLDQLELLQCLVVAVIRHYCVFSFPLYKEYRSPSYANLIRPAFNLQDPYKGSGGELTPQSCLLTSACPAPLSQ